MRLSDIEKLLSGALLPEDFELLIKQELAEHVELLEKKGASAPVYLTAIISLKIHHSDIDMLESFLSNGRLSTAAVVYVIDALSLSEDVKFDNEDVADRVQSFGLD